jgi:hypothetical protein
MNVWSSGNELATAALIARWTVLLTFAWLGHGALAQRNPRWRVALWRTVLVGLAGIGMLALVPPVLTVPVSPARPAIIAPTTVTQAQPALRELAPKADGPIARRRASG